ncbi:MAG: hypothetical protein GF317_04605 [Candidatus Lokiarchaeota archaeon]|nr:hypothetical protein [Candidatus Lokiarchaeota archaeon]
MPIYEYKCGSCGHKWDKLVSINSEAFIVCPKCGEDEEVLKEFPSSFSFAIKHGGSIVGKSQSVNDLFYDRGKMRTHEQAMNEALLSGDVNSYTHHRNMVDEVRKLRGKKPLPGRKKRKIF